MHWNLIGETNILYLRNCTEILPTPLPPKKIEQAISIQKNFTNNTC